MMGFNRMGFYSLLLLLAPLHLGFHHPAAKAEGLDPTSPSLKLKSLIPTESSETENNVSTTPRTESSTSILRLRLQGLVLSDRDHGTAIVSIDNAETRIVTLRRDQLGSATYQLIVNGKRLQIIDFSESGIVLRVQDGNDLFLVQ